jgi:hypothetical protein
LQNKPAGGPIGMRASLAALLLVLTACAAQSPATQGPFTGAVTVAGRSVPLPPGEWRVLGSQTISQTNPEGTSPRVQHLLLSQEQGGRLVNLVSVAASEPTATGSIVFLDAGQNFACQDGQGSLGPTVRNVSQDVSYDCRRLLLVGPAEASFTPSGEVWEQFRTRRAATPGWAPQRAAMVAFAMGDQRGSMAVSYMLGLPVPGPGTLQSRTQAWADAATPEVARGFNRGAGAALPAL